MSTHPTLWKKNVTRCTFDDFFEMMSVWCSFEKPSNCDMTNQTILLRRQKPWQNALWGVPGHVHDLTSPNLIYLINVKIFHCVTFRHCTMGTKVPVLYTIGLWATFWNINSSVWVAWAAQGNKDNIFLSISELLLRVVFSTICGQFYFEINVASALKSWLK